MARRTDPIACIASLDPTTSAHLAHGLSRLYPRDWPAAPPALAEAAQRAHLSPGEVVAVIAHSASGASLALIGGVPVTICPPRAYALDIDDKPKAQPKARRTRSSRRDNRVFTYVAQPNPHRPGTKAAAAYDQYAVGRTADEAVAAGARREDIRWDVSLGYVKLGPAP